MAASLYDISVPTFLQTVRAVAGYLDRTARHCAKAGADPQDLVQARLYADMAPFHFQIEALTHHAVWGVKTVQTGAFTPPPLIGAMPFANLQAMVGEAVKALEAFTPEEINACSGKTMDIVVYQPVDETNHTTSAWGPRLLTFTPEIYLLSYALPNLHFHAATAYAILRTHGIPLGKFDYQGKLRNQHAATTPSTTANP